MAKKYISFELDKTRNLRYGMQALIKIEERLGKSFAKIDFESDMKYSDLAIIIWAGLEHEDKDLTIDKVTELIDEYSDIQTALTKMSEAMAEAFGKNVQGIAEESK